MRYQWALWLGLATTSAVEAAEPPAPPLATIPVPESPEPAPARSEALEEIVVTAQKRRESLQETPISVEAFNADKLEQRGIKSLADLSANVPGMTVAPFPIDAATLLIFIRGIGLTDAQITQDPPIGIYQDGVYIARSAGLALDLVDLERIEVLRGPQGTLYGRNTTGGAINIIARRPSTGAFEMSHKIGMGSRGALLGRSSVNVPLTTDLAARLAVVGNRAGGFVDNTGPGDDFGDHRNVGARLDAHWQALDWLDADYTYDHGDLHYDNTMYQAVLPPNANHGQAESFKRYGELNTVYSAHRLDTLASGPPLQQSSSRIDGHAVTLTSEWGGQELKYIVARRELLEAPYSDLGGGKGSLTYRLDNNAYDGPAAQVANGGPTSLVVPTLTQSQWSHELQLTGDAFGESLRFIMGAFYFSETATENRSPLDHQFSSNLDPQQIQGVAAQLPPDVGAQVLTTTAPRVVNFTRFRRDIDNRAVAAFGQATWTPDVLRQRLHLTLGYRHSGDRRRAVKSQISDTYVEYRNNAGQDTATLLQSAEPFNDVHAARSFSNNAFSYIGAFDLTSSINLYAKSDEAYRSGGFNTRDPQVSGASGQASDGNTYGFGFVEGFGPEYVQSYEAGIKSEWLGRRLRLNFDVFRSSYTDMQINSLLAGTISDTKTRNAGHAGMRGLEFDGSLLALPGMILTANYAYLDARVLEVLDINGNNVASQYAFTSAPRHSGTAALDWTLWQTQSGDVRAYLSYGFTGKRRGQNLPGKEGLTALPAFGLLTARFALSSMPIAHGGLDIALWGKNLLDREYPVSAIDNLPQADRAVLWGEPRSFGLDLIYHYY